MSLTNWKPFVKLPLTFNQRSCEVTKAPFPLTDTYSSIAEYYAETGILYVDNSILTTLATCETKALMRYGYNLIPIDASVGPLRAGQAVHKALEVHYTGGTLEESLIALFDDYYEYAIAHEEEGNRLCYTNVVEIIKSWIWHHPLEKLPYKVIPDAVEMPFCLPLNDSGSIQYVGRIDAGVSNTSGAGYYLLDTKSTGRIDNKFHAQFYLSTQMSGYVWALEQLQSKPVTGIYINVVDMRSVPNNPKRKCSQHKAPYSDCGFLHMNHQLAGPYYRNQLQLYIWHRNAIRLAQKWMNLLDHHLDEIDFITSAPQSGMFIYQACTLCELHAFCRGGRNVNSLDHQFVLEPWWPGNTQELINGTN